MDSNEKFIGTTLFNEVITEIGAKIEEKTMGSISNINSNVDTISDGNYFINVENGTINFTDEDYDFGTFY